MNMHGELSTSTARKHKGSDDDDMEESNTTGSEVKLLFKCHFFIELVFSETHERGHCTEE